MEDASLVILAGGRGSRYGGLKQWMPVGFLGEPLLAYGLWDGWQAGFSQVVLVVPEGTQAQALPFEVPGQMRVRWVEQCMRDLPGAFEVSIGRCKPWGTAHAVWAAREVVQGPFAVLNADDYYGPGALARLGAYVKKGAQSALLVAYRLKNTLSAHGAVSRGVCTLKEGRLVGLREHTQIRQEAGGLITGLNPEKQRVELDPDTLVSMNCWGLPMAFWSVLEACLRLFAQDHAQSADAECYLPHCVEALMPEVSIEVCVTDDIWAGLTHPGDWDTVRALVGQRSLTSRVGPEMLL